jgi:hypothetical protein
MMEKFTILELIGYIFYFVFFTIVLGALVISIIKKDNDDDDTIYP